MNHRVTDRYAEELRRLAQYEGKYAELGILKQHKKTVYTSSDASKSSKAIRNAEVFGIPMKCRENNASYQ